MVHEVFISHTTADLRAAGLVCAALEAHGIRCWMAPRDVLPGSEYIEAIIEAINASRVMVLIVSAAANESQHLVREVERAVNKRIPLLPMRIQPVSLSKPLEYLISIPQWFDALTEPFEQHLPPLVAAVQELLSRKTRPADHGRIAEPQGPQLHHRAPLPAAAPSTGTVTFLFTDIEGSTRLWERHPDAMRAALARHDALLAAGIEQHGGTVVRSRGEGDSFFAVFPRSTDALAAAAALQQALQHEPWPTSVPLRVRMALHTGEAELREGDYYGSAVNRCARLRAVAHGGQALLSTATQELVRDCLPPGASLRDLGEHRLKDLARPERIFQLVAPDLPADFPSLLSLETLPNNLPLQLTSFIGREREVAEVKRLLSTSRLLTLTGAGGSGKTRLALQVAADVLDGFSEGVWLVELAALTDPALVPQAVATVLGISEQPGHPLTETLSESLRPRSLLLLLDNCEHLVGACAALAAALLRTCPHLRLLATSREALGVAGESTYLVPLLTLPDPRRLPPLERLTEFESVRLFMERAVLIQSSFSITTNNAPSLAQVCHRLDGIPLAIELAAARVKVLSVEQIAARLDDRFRLLTAGSRTALPRQQTLRAAIDWSYDLLSEAERALLRRLSVFAGGWTLAAAEAVCAGDGVDEYEVLDLLGQLVDKSLVIVGEQEGEARYRLLETIRQYGREHLRDSAEESELCGRHRDWYLQLAEEAVPFLSGPEQAIWLDRLETEHDNLRVALDWSVARGPAEAALRLGAALWRFWDVRVYYREGRQRLEAALVLPEAAARTAARARALNAAGALAYDQGDFTGAAALLEESRRIARECGDRESLADALTNLGNVLLDQGLTEQATGFYQEALALWRELGEPKGVARLLNNLGSVALDQGCNEEAARSYEETLALKRQLGDQRGIANALNNLGYVAISQGDYERAGPALEESLRLFQALGDSSGIATALNNLASLAFEQADLTRAAALHRDSLRVCERLENQPAIARSLEGFAAVAAAQGRSLLAARLFGAAEALRQAAGAPLPDSERGGYAQRVAAARSGTEERVWEAAWAEGRKMSLGEAIACAALPGARN